MSMLKTTLSSKMIFSNEILDANRVLTNNKVSGVEVSKELIKKLIELKTEKLSKSRKLSKFQKLAKSKELSKYKNHLILVQIRLD